MAEVSRLATRVGDLADDFLERLLMADHEKSDASRIAKEAGSWATADLWSVDYHLMHAITDDLQPSGRFFLLDDPHEHVAIHWPIDHAIALRKEGHWQMHRFASLEPKELRGITKLVPQRSLLMMGAWLADDGTVYSESHVVGLMGGNWRAIEENVRWRMRGDAAGGSVAVGHTYSSTDHADITRTTEMAIATILTERYEWHAAFGFADDGPRMVIPTNPQGCLDLFKSRDLAPGKKRRAALRHWVDTHYRQRSDDPGQIDYVREHLRGNTRFIWNALDCELMVSAFDLEKNEYFRTQAAEWRAQRKHNRVRLRRKALT